MGTQSTHTHCGHSQVNARLSTRGWTTDGLKCCRTLEAPLEARGPLWIASWLRVRRGGGATSSPGTLRGNPTPLESLAVGDEDRAWVTARAAEQTVSGTIWVHERVNERVRVLGAPVRATPQCVVCVLLCTVQVSVGAALAVSAWVPVTKKMKKVQHFHVISGNGTTTTHSSGNQGHTQVVSHLAC